MLEKIKKHLRITNNVDDDYLLDLHDVVIEYISNIIEVNISEMDEIPKPLEQAILMKIADLYDVERSNYNANIVYNDRTFNSLLDYYRNLNIKMF